MRLTSDYTNQFGIEGVERNDDIFIEMGEYPPTELEIERQFDITTTQKIINYVKEINLPRLGRNLLRVAFAGAASFAGEIISGEAHIVAAMGIGALIVGSALGGFGNAASTWLSWETDTEDRITRLEQKMKKLLPETNEIEFT